MGGNLEECVEFPAEKAKVLKCNYRVLSVGEYEIQVDYSVRIIKLFQRYKMKFNRDVCKWLLNFLLEEQEYWSRDFDQFCEEVKALGYEMNEVKEMQICKKRERVIKCVTDKMNVYYNNYYSEDINEVYKRFNGKFNGLKLTMQFPIENMVEINMNLMALEHIKIDTIKELPNNKGKTTFLNKD